MKKNYVQKVMIHVPDNRDIHALSDKVNAFHVDIMERKLNQSALTTEQKIAVIDKIMEILKLREVNGMIQ